MFADKPLRSSVLALAADGWLEPAAFERAMELAGVRPDGPQWVRFTRRACLIAGAVLLGAALIYFIAYNWHGMTRLTKLLLAAGAMTMAASGAIVMGPRGLPGRAALALAVLCLGAVLALLGQVYQTGADPYQLFTAWTLLAVPWAVAAAWGPIWAGVLVIANVALALYLGEAPSWSFYLSHEYGFASALAVLNMAAAILAESLRADQMVRLLPRLAAVLALSFATIAALASLFSAQVRADGLVLFAALLAATWGLYRRRNVDVVILAVAALEAIAVLAGALVRMMELRGPGTLFIVALVVILLSAAAAHWLRRLAAKSREDA